MYTQCKLRKGTSETTCYIETKLAKEGSRVKLTGQEGIWTIVNVYKSSIVTSKPDMHKASKDIWNATAGKYKIGHK